MRAPLVCLVVLGLIGSALAGLPPTTGYCDYETVITDDTGTVSAPWGYDGVRTFYAGGLDCMWVIQSATPVTVSFIAMNVEHGDHVYVYDGQCSDGTLMGEASSLYAPEITYTSTGSDGLTVRFTSDSNMPGNGFVFYFTNQPVTQCVNNVPMHVAGAGGVVATPLPYNGMNRALPASNCSWIIDAGDDAAIVGWELQAQDLLTETQPDVLVIYDGIFKTVIASFTSFNVVVPRRVSSTGRYMTMVYRSYNADSLGFKSSWQPVYNSPMCASATTVSGQAFGVVQGPATFDGWSRYHNDSSCVTTIDIGTTNATTNRIMFTLDAISLGADDYVTVHDGQNGAPALPGAYCMTGKTLPTQNRWFASGRRMTVEFVTCDLSNTRDLHGFKGRWSKIPKMRCPVLTDITAYAVVNITTDMGTYQNNNGSTCTYTLHAMYAGHVELTLPSVQLGEGDSIELYDNTTGLIYRGTGAIPGGVYTTITSDAYVIVTTTTSPEIRMSARTVAGSASCAAMNTTVGDGSWIQTNSPYYFPGLLPANTTCVWHVTVGAGLSVRLTFYDLFLEGTSFLRVYDNDTRVGAGENLLLWQGSSTGPLLPMNITATDNVITIVFSTTVPSHGFSALVSSINPMPCPSSNVNVALSSSTPWTRVMQPGRQDGQARYSERAACSYTFSSPVGYLPVLTWTKCSLDTGDYLRVYNGSYPVALPPNNQLIQESTGVFAAGGTPAPIAALSRFMTVLFSSDDHFQSQGYIVNVSYVPVPAQCAAFFSSNNAGSLDVPSPYNPATRYASARNCAWKVTAGVGNIIWMDFTVFDLALDGDNVMAYDGDSPSAPIIANLTGKGFKRISSTGSSMYLVFTSNAAGVASGFRANWGFGTAPTYCSGVQSVPALTTTGVSMFEPNPTGIDETHFQSYKSGSNCIYSFTAPQGYMRVQFVVSAALAAGDALTFYEGAGWPSNHVIGTYIAGSTRTTFLSQGASATMVFTSDANYTGFGWGVYVTPSNAPALCLESDVSDASTGVFSAPFPYDGVTRIPVTLHCKTVVSNSAGNNQMRFDVSPLDVESDTLFFKAYKSSDTVGNGSPFDFSYAGKSFNALGDKFLLRMSEDNCNGGLGFQIKWTSVFSVDCSGNTAATRDGGTASSQTSSDPSAIYTPGHTCTWNFTAQGPSNQIRMFFDWLDFQGTDYVLVSDAANGDTIFNSATDQYTGGLVSSGVAVNIVFSSSALVNNNHRGFSMRWVGGTIPGQCSGVTTKTGSGEVQTPMPYDGANKYAPNADCTWQLSADAAAGYSLVSLQYWSLQLAPGSSLTVYDGADTSAPSTAYVGGAPGSFSLPIPFASSSANMLIKFSSSTQSSYGFYLNWTSVNAPPMCQQYTFPAKQAQGRLSYPSPWGQGFRYTVGLDCTFVLQIGVSTRDTDTTPSRLRLDLAQMYIAAGDSLTVYDGFHTLAPVLATFTSRVPSANLSVPLVSSTGYMIVRLQTSYTSPRDYGFDGAYAPTAEHSTCPQSANVPIYNCDYEGVIMSHEPYDYVTGSNYDQECSYTIRANSGTSAVNVTLSHFIAVPGSAVEFYDGSDESAPLLLGVYSSVAPYSTDLVVSSTANHIYVRYVARVGSAFVLNWTAVGDVGPRTTGCALIEVPLGATTTSTTGTDAIPGAIQSGLSQQQIIIIGAGGGGALLLLICVVAVVILCLRRRKSQKQVANNKELNGDSTVKLDIGPDGALKKRIQALMRANSTKQIGKGGTAVVYKAHMDDGRWVALKQLIDATKEATQEFHREVTIFSRLSGKSHPNVLGLVMFCNDPPVIVCELAEKGSLHRMRKDFAAMDVPQKKALLLQVAEGMRFLHDSAIVHLDLKPENCLMDENNVIKISDFGTSMILGEDIAVDYAGLSTVTSAFSGTPQYSAPERFRHGVPIDLKRADVFSFGVVAWSIVTGSMPFEGESGETIVSMHMSNSFRTVERLPLSPDTDPILADVIARAALEDFRKRPTFFDVSSTLKCDDISAVPTVNYSERSGSTTGPRPRNMSFGRPLESISHNSIYTGESTTSSLSSSTFGTVVADPPVEPYTADSINNYYADSTNSNNNSMASRPPPPMKPSKPRSTSNANSINNNGPATEIDSMSSIANGTAPALPISAPPTAPGAPPARPPRRSTSTSSAAGR